MKKIGIIGKNSYIGDHIKAWIESKGADFSVETIDARDNHWKDYDFSSLDALIHVAGIVHRPDVQDWNIYKNVNVDLPVQVAETAKSAGVKQFVFLSTMGVYGLEKKLVRNVIDETTETHPTSMYGRSKYEAELLLKDLEDESFTVTVVRPPNVYGKNCRGGYITGFASIVRRLPFIPDAYDGVKQSVIYIDNLSELIYQLVSNRLGGTFMPQDDRAVSAVELMQALAQAMNIKRRESRVLGLFAYLLSWTSLARKAYGGIEYADSLSTIKDIDYRVVTFNEGIKRTI